MTDVLEHRQETAKERASKTKVEIPETSPLDQHEEIEDKLIKARIEMLIQHPFL